MTQAQRKSITILLAEDDPDDVLMAKEAFRENHVCNNLIVIEDGEVLMDYLHCRNVFAGRDPA